VILSKSARYALRACLCLAEADPPGRLAVDEIARRLDVPRNYLSKILHMLAGTDILRSTRGPHGGFELARAPGELTLHEIVRHFDEVPDETRCLLGRERCSDVDPCRAHERWSTARSAFVEFLTETRLTDLAPESPLPEPP
jgi:Rrf2 family protein